MKGYIDRTALKERFQKRLIWLKKDVHDEYSKGLFHGCETDMGLIDEIPAAEVAEMKRGHWEFPISTDSDDGLDPRVKCSECGEEVRGDDVPATHPWCHSCGARMDKEDEHEVS